jgi:hypothetical protein
MEALGRGAPLSARERAQDLQDTVLKRWAT